MAKGEGQLRKTSKMGKNLHKNLYKNVIFYNASIQSIYICGINSKHSLVGRILTSVVVIWFCRKSRSALSVSRLRDAVCRFFSRRAWASSMSYSNMTLAFEREK